MIQERLAEYEAELQRVIREFGDETSMAYFSDRFGFDHPRSARADEGVRIQRQLIQMKVSLVKFAETFDADYPPLADSE